MIGTLSGTITTVPLEHALITYQSAHRKPIISAFLIPQKSQNPIRYTQKDISVSVHFCSSVPPTKPTTPPQKKKKKNQPIEFEEPIATTILLHITPQHTTQHNTPTTLHLAAVTHFLFDGKLRLPPPSPSPHDPHSPISTLIIISVIIFIITPETPLEILHQHSNKASCCCFWWWWWWWWFFVP